MIIGPSADVAMSSNVITDSCVSDEIATHADASSDSKSTCDAASTVFEANLTHTSPDMKVMAETGNGGDCESLCDAVSCNGTGESTISNGSTHPDELALLEKLDQANRLIFLPCSYIIL